MSPLRLILAAAVVLVMGAAILGIGQGESPLAAAPPRGRTLSPQEVRASRQRVVAGGEQVRHGRHEFAEQGCGACHTLAAIGADGELGPRLDRRREPVQAIAGSIAEPEAQGQPGYDRELMPRHYEQELGKEGVAAVAAFIKAASG